MPIAAFPKCFLNKLVAGEMTPEAWVELAADLEIDGLEFYWGFSPRENEKLEKLRAYVESHGLCVPMMCYSPDFIQPDLDKRRHEVEKQKEVIAATAKLGGRFCRVLSGQRRDDVSRHDGVKMAADCINQLLPFAEKHNVVLILENHYKDGFWDFPEFAQKMDVFLELLDAIPQNPYFGVNYDPSNAIIAGDDPIELLEAVKHRVVSMHASDRYFEGGSAEDLRKLEAHPQQGYAPILKHGVIGQGLNDYDKIFSILKSVGFKGWISIEDGEDATVGMAHLRDSAIFLRQKMKEHDLP